MKYTRLLCITGFLICLPSLALAQGQQSWSFTGGFQLGLRAVDVEGSEETYRQHLNLEDGPRLFNLNFELTPTAEMRSLFDRIELDLSNLGGDPFETIRFSVEKYGRYAFTYDRRKSTYFYDDVILPAELGSPPLANAGDYHTFDFDRVQDTADFKLWMSDAAHLHFGFNRFTKKGSSTTSADIERDEFEFDKPIDESMSEYRLALQYVWPRATLILEGRLRDYENAIEIFLPGLSEGEDPEDAALLASYFLDQPYDLRSFTPSLRLVARPTDRLNLRFYAAAEDLSLDVDLSEHAQGTTWQGEPYETSATGSGKVEREAQIYDLDLSYQFSDHFAVVLGARQHSLDQDGAMTFDEAEGTGVWKIDTTSYHLGLQYDLSSRFTITGGFRSEQRDVESGWTLADGGSAEDESSDHSGYFLTLGWRPTRQVRVSARVDDSSYDHPFTLSSPSDRLAYRITAQWSQGMGFSVSGVYRSVTVENDVSGWKAGSDSANLRVGYRAPGLSLSAGYTLISIDRDIDQMVAAGGIDLFFPIAYRADSDFIDARVVWAAATRLKVGAEARWHDNSGSFAMQRQNLHAFVEMGFGQRYMGHLGYRDVDYDEVDYDWDDYRAKIWEISIGYRW